jgi:hypothetical protein
MRGPVRRRDLSSEVVPLSKEGAVVRTKRTWLLVAGLAVLPLALVLAIALVSGGHALAGLLVAATSYGAFFGLLQAWVRRWRVRVGRLRADERGLWLDGEAVVRRESVRHGYVVRSEGATFVRLARMLRHVEVSVADDAEGEELLAAMRLDPARSVAQYAMNHGTYRSQLVRLVAMFTLWIPSTFGLLVVAKSAELFILSLLVWAVVMLVWAVNQSVAVSVGADGIRLRRRLSGSRFVPFGAIASAETDGQNVTLRLRDGTVLEVNAPAGPEKEWKPALFQDRGAEATKLTERIREGMAQHERGSVDDRVLARGGRQTRDWLRDVTVASDEHASFRVPALPPDQLWRVVEDPAAATTARAGAAAALRPRLDDEGRARLRVVADACAAPELRVALEAAALAEEAEELEPAFDALRDNEDRRALRRR